MPVGAYARDDGAELDVIGLAASGDGRIVIRLTRRGREPEVVGAEVARALLDGGAAAIEGFEHRCVRGERMTVYLVGAGPGDPGLLTRRGARVLRRADVVLHDRLVSPAVLDLVPPSAELIDVGKVPERVRRPAGGDRTHAGGARPPAATVVRLKGGDPFLFGRGGEEIEVLDAAGIDWEVVPGVTSAFGVPAALGIPVTHRGLASSVTVVTGRVGETGGRSGPDWEALARTGGTLIVVMGMTDARRRGRRADARRPGARHAGGGDLPRDLAGRAACPHHPGRLGRRRARGDRP